MNRYAIYRNGQPYSVMTASDAAAKLNFQVLRSKTDTYEYLVVDTSVMQVAQIPAYDKTKVKAV